MYEFADARLATAVAQAGGLGIYYLNVICQKFNMLTSFA
jgi:NAD(P)H-dependent flavin oxidoreductase YrpB (nitropropane dioxygenase family)